MNGFAKKVIGLTMLAIGCCCLFSSQAFAQAGVDTYDCRLVQLDAQAAVAAGGPYKNHGALVSTAAAVVDAAVTAGTIDAECASCIMNQFARRIEIADQDSCGPDSPNPECEGAQCGTFVPCNVPNSCTQPICATTAEGGGVCLEGTTACAGLTPCPIGNECLPGAICAINTCCGINVCVPPRRSARPALDQRGHLLRFPVH